MDATQSQQLIENNNGKSIHTNNQEPIVSIDALAQQKHLDVLVD